MLFVNPGSPSLPRHIRQLGTVAVLELEPERRAARLIELGASPGAGAGGCNS